MGAASARVRVVGACGHGWTLPFARARDKSRLYAARATCPTCHKKPHVTFDFSGRRCKCGNPLAGLNPGPDCFACHEAYVAGLGAVHQRKETAA